MLRKIFIILLATTFLPILSPLISNTARAEQLPPQDKEKAVERAIVPAIEISSDQQASESEPSASCATRKQELYAIGIQGALRSLDGTIHSYQVLVADQSPGCFFTIELDDTPGCVLNGKAFASYGSVELSVPTTGDSAIITYWEKRNHSTVLVCEALKSALLSGRKVEIKYRGMEGSETNPIPKTYQVRFSND